MSGVDMLHGPLLLKILWFSLPLAASSLLEQLFNSVDIAVVGHFVGSNALAAVGSNAPVIVRYCRNKVLYDKYLLMEGLWDIYQKNH